MVGISRAPQVQEPHLPVRKRILVVDDHEVVREGVGLLINAAEDLCVCATAATAGEARQAVDTLSPDLAVIDLSLGAENGLDLVRWIKHRNLNVKIIVSSMHDEQYYGLRALRAGANGYVSKSEPARMLLDAIRQVIKGETCFSKNIVNRVVDLASETGEMQRSEIELLADREIEVFRCIGQGMTGKEIAHALHLSVSTVDTYRERLKTKLGLKHSAQLVHHATRWVLENH